MICLAILTEGTCTDAQCTQNHNVTTCEACRRVFDSAITYSAHLTSTAHHIAVRRSSSTGWLHCYLCNSNPCGASSWNNHIRSRRHARASQLAGISPNIEPEEIDTIPGQKFCATCNSQIPVSAWDRHIAGAKHRAKEEYMTYTAVLEEAESDKHNVVVSKEFDFGVVEPGVAKLGVKKLNRVTTTEVGCSVRLVSATLQSSKNASSLSVFSLSISGTRLTSLTPLTITLSAKQAFAGREEDRLELLFEDTKLHSRFLIVRQMRIVVGNRAQYEALQPKVPYKPKRRTAGHSEKAVEPGVKAPSLGAVPYVVKLPTADIPAQLKEMLERGSVKKMLPHLTDKTYARQFKYLIWIEEFKMSQDLEHYDINDAQLTRHNSYYYVQVPGLAEKRPSVLVGDSILVRHPTDPEGHWFEGGVHVVHKEEVGLRLAARFTATPSDRMTVRFKLNRYPLRRQHQALDTAFAPERIFFPTAEMSVLALSRVARKPSFNRLIDANKSQRMAVDAIVAAPPGSIPFIIFGPPGTGKTVTLVESILHLLAHKPDAKILACAPSNSAADLIAQRLISIGNRKLFRFYAPSRPSIAVPTNLEPFTYKSESGHFSVPSPTFLKEFSVCVTTCVSASVFFGTGVPRGHFGYVFVDEAGQATEPESMIAIKTMADHRTNVVLGGDPKQLGPIVRAAVAREGGLEMSYLERLMSRKCYQEDTKGVCVVKLTQNFRSHERILKFPNEQFYGGELVACGEPKEINAFIDSPLLPAAGRKFPIMFVAMSGQDMREASSPSFFNIEEALMVKEKVEALRGDRNLRLNDNDIGVITPYHAQVQKIRKTLSLFASGIKVGSVEEFQGQERKVVIISTVRSSREFVEYDLKHTLGFVANPRRFNVAVTRAKALLIVIGDPLVLSLDPLWRQFLNYIHNNGGWSGKGITWDPKAPVNMAGGYVEDIRDASRRDMNEFTKKMEEMTLEGMDDNDGLDVNVDRPWNRDDE